MVPFEKSKTVSFCCSLMENIVVPSALFRFPINLTGCIAFESTSSFSCLLKSIAINRDNLVNIQLCNHQLQFLECYHMFLNHFLLVDQKNYFHCS